MLGLFLAYRERAARSLLRHLRTSGGRFARGARGSLVRAAPDASPAGLFPSFFAYLVLYSCFACWLHVISFLFFSLILRTEQNRTEQNTRTLG